MSVGYAYAWVSSGAGMNICRSVKLSVMNKWCKTCNKKIAEKQKEILFVKMMKNHSPKNIDFQMREWDILPRFSKQSKTLFHHESSQKLLKFRFWSIHTVDWIGKWNRFQRRSGVQENSLSSKKSMCAWVFFCLTAKLRSICWCRLISHGKHLL